MKKQIEVRKSEYKFIKWKEIKAYDFNSLKEASQRDVSKLKNAIVNNKFSFPFYVWKRFVIDGAGRKKALEELEAEGYLIPDLPFVEIEANNQREAKRLVLQASSEHGRVTEESFNLFTDDLELSEIELGEFNFDLPMGEGEGVNIDFNDIESNENREKKFKTQFITCPQCEHGFEVQT